MQKEEMFSMRKKRFTAFLLSLAMAGTSLYTCGVIDVQAAAVAEEGTENPNLEQLTEIQEQAAAVEEVAEPEVQAEAAEEVAESEVQAADIDSPIKLTNVNLVGEEYQAGWDKTIGIEPEDNYQYKYGFYNESGTVAVQDVPDTMEVGLNKADFGKTLCIRKQQGNTVVDKVDIKVVAVEAKNDLLTFKGAGTSKTLSYNSAPQTPEVVVSDNATTYQQGSDYTISYRNNKEVGTAYVDVTFLSGVAYTGTITREFKIVTNNINGVSVNVPKTYTYTGDPIVPEEFTVASGNIVLTPDDYEIKWENNVNSGNATANVKVTGALNRFKTGTYDVPAFLISQNTNAKFVVSLKGDGTYPIGTSLNKISADVVVSTNVPSKGLTTVSTDDYDVTLVAGDHGVVSGADRFNKTGRYSLKVVGKRNYDGAKVSENCAFTIGGIQVSADAIKVSCNSANCVYDGKPQELVISSVSINGTDSNGNTVTSPNLETTAYKVTYNNNINATSKKEATATLEVINGDFIGSKKVISFNISQADLNTYIKAEPVKTEVTYNGGPQKPEYKLTAKSGAYVIEPKDYTIVCSSNGTGAGTTSGNWGYKVSANASGNYTGAIEGLSCKILQKNISDNSITGFDVEGKTYNYTSHEVVPEFTLRNSELVSKIKVLTKDKDYEVKPAKGYTNDEKGPGKIVVTGKGNYCGTMEATFNIGDRGFTKVMVSTNNQVPYTGKVLSVGDLHISVSSGTFEVPKNQYTAEIGTVQDAGPYTLTIKGKNDYSDAADITCDYTVMPRDFVSGNVSVGEIVAYKYKGGEVAKPVATLYDKGLSKNDARWILSENRDYTLEVVKGTASDCRIRGMGNYTEVELPNTHYTVSLSDLAKVASVSSDGVYVYTSEKQTIEPGKLKVRDYVHDVDLVYRQDFVVDVIPSGLEAGTVNMTLRGINDYTGTTTVSINIAPQDISADAVKQISMNDYTESVNYSGETVEYKAPDAFNQGCLSFNKDQLTAVKDYDVKLQLEDGTISSNYKNAGTYKIVAVAKENGNYTGVRVLGTLVVNALPLSKDQFKLNNEKFDYVEGQTPNVVVIPTVENILQDRDYTIDYGVNTGDRGTHTITITGKGNYSGTVELTYVVGPITLSEGNTAVYYAGTTSDNQPIVQVTVEGKSLRPDKDYKVVSVSEIPGSDPKAWNVTIEGKDAYEGSVTKEVKVGKIMILDLNVAVSGDFTYNGQAQAPTAADVVVTVAGKVLSQNTDYTLVIPEGTVNAGSYEVEVTGTGDYEGVAKGAYEIKAISFAEENVTVGPTVEYTGSNVTPPVTVTVDGKTLVAGVDYVVDTEADMQNVGEKTLTIIGIGNYANSTPVTKKFKVVQASMTGAQVNVTRVTYTGAAQTAKVTSVIVNGRVLKAGVDYTVETKRATNAGTVKVKVTGKGNYVGTATGNFVINKKNLASCKISGVKDRVYVGKGKVAALPTSLKVVVDGKTLKRNVDFWIKYSDNTKIGEVTYTINGKGNYTGTTTSRTYRIYPKKAAISSLKAGSKNFTVQIKRQGGGIQYQVQYRLKGAKGYTRVESKKAKVVVKGLRKGKTYVVRVRTYKKVGGKTYYGEFSKARNVKIK